MTESELIEQYFLSTQLPDNGIALGIGDDAAVINIPADKQLVVSTDTLVSNIHFHSTDKAEDIGYKTLAVNLSDMAAMGAEPKWVSMSLTLAEINHDWLKAFSDSFFELANEHSLALIGGDLCRGSLSVSIHIQGLVSKNKYVTRSGARVGDNIYVTGTLGDAGAALKLKSASGNSPDHQYLQSRLLRPTARIEAGLKLAGFVNSMIDLSDGLIQDLTHISRSSAVGAEIFVDQIPLSEQIKNLFSYEEALSLALSAGDDYELCFTAPAETEHSISKLFETLNCPISKIGIIRDGKEIKLTKNDGQEFKSESSGYQHFSS